MEKFQNKYRIPSARLQNWDYGANGAYFITICTKNMAHFFGDVVSVPTVPTVETRFIASNSDNNHYQNYDDGNYDEGRRDELRNESRNEERCDKSRNESRNESLNEKRRDKSRLYGDIRREMKLNELGKIAHTIWEEIINQFPFVELGNFIIMPNHMHGILIINKMKFPSDDAVETRFIASKNRDDDEKRRDKSQNEKRRDKLRLYDGDSDEKGGFAGEKNPMLNDNISRIIRWYKGRCSFEMRKIHADFEWHSRFHDHIIRNSVEFERIQNYIENNPSNWKEDKFYK
jgi:putative transposase